MGLWAISNVGFGQVKTGCGLGLGAASESGSGTPEVGCWLWFVGDKQCGFRSGENRVRLGDAVSVSGNS